MTIWKAIFLGFALIAGPCAAQKEAQKITVPMAPPPQAEPQQFKDSHFGVRFQVPAGWSLTRKDGLVSTFHDDARTASPKARVRGVASLDFNPFPESTLSGAMFYFSVEPHSNDGDCARQASVLRSADEPNFPTDVQDIGGMRFTHGHDEHGEICVEARDEVYTAYRKGSCYRFDMEINTFCSISSGAQEITDRQLRSVNQQMADILSTVTLQWEKSGAHPVPVPQPSTMVQRPTPRPEPKPVQQTRGTVAVAAEE
jgi:hypothetical protein